MEAYGDGHRLNVELTGLPTQPQVQSPRDQTSDQPSLQPLHQRGCSAQGFTVSSRLNDFLCYS